MPIVDDLGGLPVARSPRPEGEEGADPTATGGDPYAMERDLLAMPLLPWKAMGVTLIAVALVFGVTHLVLLALKEQDKLITNTMALRAQQATPVVATVSPVGDEAVRIPAGPFTMGREIDDEGTNSDATPPHRVDLPEYYIGRYEVTNAQYQAFVDATGYIPPPHWRGETTFPEGTGALPVTHVNQAQAAAYAEWRGGRLCREAEWEKAARGDDQRIYPYGNDYDPSRANIDYLMERLMPVGHYPTGASPYGVMDMMGNIYEWTADRYYPYPGNQDDRSDYAAYVVDEDGNVSIDPDQESYYAITRGGCWKCDRFSSQATTRNPTRPDYASDFFGFRACWDGIPDRQ